MRYITQFEIVEDIWKNKDYAERHIEYQKNRSSCELGNLIAKTIGFTETISSKRWELEIVAFTLKDWVKFKNTLKEYIETTQGTLSTFNLMMIGKMLKELESIGIENKEIQQNGKSA